MEILRTSYYTLGSISEPCLGDYDLSSSRWEEEFNNRDNWDFDSRSGAAGALSLRWLSSQRVARFGRWLHFTNVCNKKSKLMKAVSELNKRYHAYRRMCEKQSDWRWVYLTASQYRTIRYLLWRKIK